MTLLGPGKLVRWPYLVLVGCSVIIPESAEGRFVTLPGPGGGTYLVLVLWAAWVTIPGAGG